MKGEVFEIDTLVALIGVVSVAVGGLRGCRRRDPERRSSGLGRYILVLVPVDYSPLACCN